MSNTNERSIFHVHTHCGELYSVFNGISHYKLVAIFLPNRWDFLSDKSCCILSEDVQTNH